MYSNSLKNFKKKLLKTNASFFKWKINTKLKLQLKVSCSKHVCSPSLILTSSKFKQSNRLFKHSLASKKINIPKKISN
jgi:hypothetical protein